MASYTSNNLALWAEDQGVIILPQQENVGKSRQNQGSRDERGRSAADANRQLQQLQQRLQTSTQYGDTPGRGNQSTNGGPGSTADWGVDETLYTTKLDDSKFTPEQIARADQIAREIMGSKPKRR